MIMEKILRARAVKVIQKIPPIRNKIKLREVLKKKMRIMGKIRQEMTNNKIFQIGISYKQY